MWRKAEAELTKRTAATAADQVGFGEWADLTYGQVLTDHPGLHEMGDTDLQGGRNWRLGSMGGTAKQARHLQRVDAVDM